MSPKISAFMESSLWIRELRVVGKDIGNETNKQTRQVYKVLNDRKKVNFDTVIVNGEMQSGQSHPLNSDMT